MNTQHTPGPWWETESGVRDRGGLICHTISPQRYPGQEDRFERETIERTANKKLIAAAPDMYEALKKLLADAEHVRDVALREVGIGMVNELALESARAALAKASGESK
ncbi:hypothetical protein [Castellaniella sp.]|uniref:hypothetical protein n=1 Tax=Castellaniella sp. TaxID=1955812 RepID=UPI002AFEFC28|nr:hypothetical protein [Castellaniella sp.]